MRGWQALASGAAVLMVACLTRLTNGAPRWTLLDSGLDGVHPAANALTTFALVVVVFLALLLVFPLESAQKTRSISARRQTLGHPKSLPQFEDNRPRVHPGMHNMMRRPKVP